MYVRMHAEYSSVGELGAIRGIGNASCITKMCYGFDSDDGDEYDGEVGQ